MKPIANHRPRGKRVMRSLWDEGVIPPFSESLEIPVLSTSNYKNTMLGRIMNHDPLFFLDERQESKWDWWLKILSVEEHAKRFLSDGHNYFLYLDSGDSFIWRKFTAEDCREYLGDCNLKFQDGEAGFPPWKPFNTLCKQLFGGTTGPCAGAYIAEAGVIQTYVDIIRSLKTANSPTLFNHKKRSNQFGRFDDQAAWRTIACLFPRDVGIELQHRNNTVNHGVLTKIFPDKNTWKRGVDSVSSHPPRR